MTARLMKDHPTEPIADHNGHSTRRTRFCAQVNQRLTRGFITSFLRINLLFNFPAQEATITPHPRRLILTVRSNRGERRPDIVSGICCV